MSTRIHRTLRGGRRLMMIALLAGSWLPGGTVRAIEPDAPPSAPAARPAEPEPDDPGATIERGVRSALREAERAISRAAEIGRDMAARVTAVGRPAILVLPGAKIKGEAADALGEDLAVMTRLVEKAARGDDSERRPAAGRGTSPGGRDLNALYLDGFGALFLVDVGFPLVAPRDVKRTKESESADPEWEAARRSVQSEARNGGGARWDWRRPLEGEPAEFDEGRVEAFRKSLIRTLRHAANLRGMGPEETVAVVVFGPAPLDPALAGGPRRPGRRFESRTVVMGEGPGKMDIHVEGDRDEVRGSAVSVMTLRVRKADAEAFAKGELKEDEFTKRVQISTR